MITRTGQQRLEDIDPQKDAAIDFLNGLEVVSESMEADLLEDEPAGE